MSCPKKYKCPKCGDRLIHQLHRGMQESSSAFGQHLFDEYAKHFYFCDVDGVIYKCATKILRLVEQKPRNGRLRPSQLKILPLLAAAIENLVQLDIVHSESGVFCVQSEPPFNSGVVSRITPPWSHNPVEAILAGSDFDTFKAGELFGKRRTV